MKDRKGVLNVGLVATFRLALPLLAPTPQAHTWLASGGTLLYLFFLLVVLEREEKEEAIGWN